MHSAHTDAVVAKIQWYVHGTAIIIHSNVVSNPLHFSCKIVPNVIMSMLGVPLFFITFFEDWVPLFHTFFLAPENFSIDSCKLKRNSGRDMHIAKQKGGPHGGPHTCGGRGRGEVPSASASCEPNSTCKPFSFPLYYFHTPQSCPVDEEVDLLDHGRAAAN